MGIAVERARLTDLPEASAIVDEYCDAIDVAVRDETLLPYFRDGCGLWLAREGAITLGCIALRPLPAIEGACEVKRLYVRPAFRGRGVADLLLDALHGYASACGYGAAYLDTKDDLRAAIRFYERRGYEPCARYNDNPQATVFMRRALRTV
ncbi:MAG: GNAT family N-acetyltransferase [Candidatus Baltobacteraceae bacterium]|jgi:GNAT superfamily N-acetyltransferase